MSDTIKLNRRSFLGATPASLGALGLGLLPQLACADSVTGKPALRYASGGTTSREIRSLPNIGYSDIGPRSGQPVILLHGCTTNHPTTTGEIK